MELAAGPRVRVAERAALAQLSALAAVTPTEPFGAKLNGEVHDQLWDAWEALDSVVRRFRRSICV